MGAIDLLVDEVGSRFGLTSAKAGSLLTSVLSLMQEQNGFSGFLDRFRKVGLSDAVSGWLSGAPTSALSADTLQSALGSQTVNNIASRTGLSLATVTSALGFMIPKLVQSLAPGGAIPTRLPPEAMSYLTGATGMVTAGARQAVHAAESTNLRRWLWPLLAVIALLLLFWLWPRSKSVSFNIEDQIKMASDKAMAALSALKRGFAPQDLTSALNLEIINFDTGSAQIPEYSKPFLNKAAEVIKTGPQAMVIEIDGHTDNTGDAAANLALSQQRAEAVLGYLVQQGVPASQLTAKGFGDTRPVVSNDTEEGRFRNRRIEFSAH
ncbi:MAG TPA: OmpA family protein [Terriglobales bacterium]|nr:OmpA family protein [Terriglobales bacterium]